MTLFFLRSITEIIKGMLNYHQSTELIELPKIPSSNTPLTNGNEYILSSPTNSRVHLEGEYDPAIQFFWKIWQSRKNFLKLSLHLQNENGPLPLLRIDFNGSHQNPQESNAHVPEKLKRYTGHFFQNEAHIHFNVEGYAPLKWALPLEEDDFFYKKFTNENALAEICDTFCQRIHLSGIRFNMQLRAL